MEKGDFAITNFLIIEDFFRDNNAPQCLKEELAEFAIYFKDYSWARKASFDTYSNGAYLGMKQNGRRHHIGMYVFNDGDIYLGEWYNGVCQGRGFYYFASGSVYWGEWKNDLRHGKGHIWRPGYESEGTYYEDKEIHNMYVRSSNRNQSYSRSSSSSSSGGTIAIIIIILLLIYFLS